MSEIDCSARLQAMQDALPTRPLALKNAGDGGLLTQILYIIAGFAIFLGIGAVSLQMVGDIMQDRKIAANPIVLEQAMIDGSCDGTRKLPFVRGCEVKISNDGVTVERSFSFLGFGGGDYEVDVLAQADDPSNMNVSLAAEKMTNRFVTVGVLLFIGLAGLLWGISTLKAIPAKQRTNKLFNEPANQPWQFVALPVRFEYETLYFDTTIDGVTKEAEVSCNQQKPLFLGAEENLVVAIKAKNSDIYLPLLDKLNNIDFVKAERKALMDAYRQLS